MNETAIQTAPDKVIFESIAEVQDFVDKTKFKHNISDPIDGDPTCVDGRKKGPSKNPGIPITARPGGSAGEIMTILAACNTLNIHDNNRILETYLTTMGGPENFNFHTDDEHTHEPGVGCGHLNKARQHFSAYGLDAEQMEFIFKFLPQVKEQGAEEEIRLGDHLERGALIVESEKWSLQPFLDDGSPNGIQSFIKNQTFEVKRHKLLAKALYDEFSSDRPELLERDFLHAVNSAAELQQNQTFERIAIGVPVFQVKINDVDGTATVSAA